MRMLTSDDEFMRSSAAEGCQGLAKPSPQVIAALMKICTSDSYEYGRANAAETLGGVQPSTKEISAALTQAVGDESETVRRHAATALGKVEPKFDDAIPALVAATKDENNWVRESATASLGKYQGAADARLGAIVDGMLKAGRVSYGAESSALSSGAAEFYPLLVKVARDAQADEARRALAVHGLVAMLSNEQFATAERKREMGSVVKSLATDSGQPPTVRAAAACSLRFFDDLKQYEDPSLWIAGVEQGKLAGTRASCINLIGWEKVKAGIPAMVKALEDPDKDVVSTAISSLPSFGADAAPAVPGLIKLLNDTQPLDRYTICSALGEIGMSPDLCLPALAPFIDYKENGSTRSTAMKAIAQLVVKHDLDAAPWIPKFLARLPKEESYNRDSVVNALKTLGPKAAPATAQLIPLLSDESQSLRDKTAEALGEIGPGAKAATPALLEAIKTWKEPGVAIAAFGKIQHDGDAFAPLVPKLFENLELRRVTLEALGNMGPAAAPALPHVVKLLESTDANERYIAAQTLGKVGEGAKDAVAKLKQLATDDDKEYVRRAASEAIGKIAPNDPALAELTLASVKDLNGYQLERKIKEWGERAPNLVRAGLTSTSPSVRGAAYRLLPLVVADPLKAVPVLQKALDDDDAGVQFAAASTLANLNQNSPRQLAVLIGGLGAENSDEYALQEAIKKGGSAAIGPLLVVITDSKKNDNARRCAVEALSDLPLRHNQAAPLRKALTSTDAPTREWAAIALARLPRDKAAAVPQIVAALKDPASPRFQSSINVADRLAEYGEPLPDEVVAAVLDVVVSDEKHVQRLAQLVGHRPLSQAQHDRIVALVDDEAARERALAIARRMTYPDARLVPHLLSQLDRVEEYERRQVLQSVARTGKEGLAQLAAFALDDTKPAALRALALESLGRQYQPSAEEREQFAALLTSDDAELRMAAAVALASWQHDWKAVEPHLLAALQQSNNLRYSAATVIGERRADARGLLDQLLPLIASGDEEQRSAVIGLLAALAPDSPAAATALVNVIRGGAADNYSALESLAAFGAAGREALLSALATTTSDEQRVRLLAALPQVEWADDDREKATAVARSALKSSSPDVQVAAALILPSLDAQATDVLPILLPIIEAKVAEDADNRDQQQKLETRRWAAFEAVKRLKAAAKPAIPVLIKLLDDKESAVSALSVLAAIGPDAAPATAKIIPQLAQEDRLHWAIEALTHIGPGAKDAVPALTALLSDEQRAPSAARALAAITSPEETLPLVYKNLKHPTLRYAAIETLGGLGEQGAAATPVLAKALTVDDPDLRVAAARALASIGKPAASAAPGLVAALASDDALLRVAAAEALGGLKADSALAVAPLVKLLADEETDVRRSAAFALGNYGQDAAPAVASLQPLLQDKRLVRAAASTLGKIGPAAAPAVPELVQLAASDNAEAYIAVDALGGIGAAAKEAVPALVKLVDDHHYGNMYSRRRLSAALWKIDPAAAEKTGLERPPPEEESNE